MGIGIGSMHKLLPSSTGAILSSLPNIPDRERCRPAPLLIMNMRQAMPVRMPNRWNATIFIACNRYLFRCTNSHSLQNLDISTFRFRIPLHAIYQHSLIPLTSWSYHRSPWSIRCTGATIHKYFMWLLLPTSLSPNPDLRRRRAWHPAATAQELGVRETLPKCYSPTYRLWPLLINKEIDLLRLTVGLGSMWYLGELYFLPFLCIA